MSKTESRPVDLVSRLTKKTARSKAIAAAHRMTTANHQFLESFRFATKEMVYPIVAERSSGARLWDVDGNEYVDYCMGFGVHLFGHNPPFVIDAVARQLERGIHVGPQAELAGEAGELFCRVTGAERVFFSNTGTEAVMSAIRIARAVTRRSRIVMFQGAYHGHADHVLVSRVSKGKPETTGGAPGIPHSAGHDAQLLDYGAPQALDYLRENASSIAAVLVDPMPVPSSEIPSREFLRELRVISEQHGAALVFDEVVTALRLGPRGAQGWFDVPADLAAYGKVLAGGLPIGAVAGRARFMNAVDGGVWSYGDASCPSVMPTFVAGTFCRHPLAMAAAHAVLTRIEQGGQALYDDLNARSRALAGGLAAATHGMPIDVDALGSLIIFRPRAGQERDLLIYHLLDRGVYTRRLDGFMSTAHEAADCQRLVTAVRDAMAEMVDAGVLG